MKEKGKRRLLSSDQPNILSKKIIKFILFRSLSPRFPQNHPIFLLLLFTDLK